MRRRPRGGAARRRPIDSAGSALYSCDIVAKPRRGDRITISIDDLAFGGEGVGRAGGYVVFVRGGLPGDRLTIRIVDSRARFGRGEIEAIEEPSPHRVDAPCPHFGPC